MPKTKREFLKAYDWSQFEGIKSDQMKGFPRPDLHRLDFPRDVKCRTGLGTLEEQVFHKMRDPARFGRLRPRPTKDPYTC